jgi:hypothetical protein
MYGMPSFSEFFADERKYTAKIDGPMTFGYGIDATDSARKNQRRGTNICFSRQRARADSDQVGPYPAALK